MKRFLLFTILIVLFLIVISLNLTGEVKSRIEVEVFDKVTNKPIEGARVYHFFFYDNGSCGIGFDTITDAKGFIKIDNLGSAKFFIAVTKDGYAPYGPFDKTFLKNYRKETMFIGSSIKESDVSDYTFYLKEGEIKHIKVRLKKGANVVVNLFKKYPHGIFPVTGTLEAGTLVYHKGYIYPFISDKKDLKPGKVKIGVGLEGYSEKFFDNIILKSGQTVVLNHTFDYTKGQVIHGKIIEKNKRIPLEGVKISLLDEEDNEVITNTFTDKNGEFWMGGFSPGMYKIWYELRLEVDKMEIIRINQNQKIKINKEFILK